MSVCVSTVFLFGVYVHKPTLLSISQYIHRPSPLQALKRDSSNAETYYKRAALFEEKGDILLALEDYTIANKLCPSNTVAILKKGKYNFERGFVLKLLVSCASDLNKPRKI